MRWVYGDPHYYHKNVIKYCDRIFSNVEHMNTTMIAKHNALVHKEDKVFIVGDFAFTNKLLTREIVNQLNGNIILIMGNHDRKRTRTWLLDCKFHQVIEYPIIIQDSFILSHEPVFLTKNSVYINIHGHLHGNILVDETTYKSAMSSHLDIQDIQYNKYINVCLDNNDFYPFNLDTIINTCSSISP